MIDTYYLFLSSTRVSKYSLDLDIGEGNIIYAARAGTVIEIVDDQYLSKFDVCDDPSNHSQN